MNVITTRDTEFSTIQKAYKRSFRVGAYLKGGALREVAIDRHIVIVALEEDSRKFAVHTARSYSEAETFAQQLLDRAQRRGNELTNV